MIYNVQLNVDDDHDDVADVEDVEDVEERDKTRSQFNHSYESGKWMKVKVAKCCWKK